MSLTEQYALDLYRAALRGEPAPPAPGRHDWRTVRELREYRDAQAVPAGRPARRRSRHDRLTDAPGAVRAMPHAVRAMPGAVRAIREALAALRLRSAVPLRELPDPVEEGTGRGRDVVSRPVECG
ncbi:MULTISPECIES: hypothetical protein [Streptomyces]|uniref:Uncharacterized protein n=1 Tax=Streptomyces melanosporofaciens TaxID=67327 RepID=A0A1H4Q549_STRMJ|nr:hypothetical protein [Streptomyces melanosporofaciens]SEC14729.1 hypothetical protein SAMN04490356_3077 [Streptomyces melanosporofaciens]